MEGGLIRPKLALGVVEYSTNMYLNSGQRALSGTSKGKQGKAVNENISSPSHLQGSF